MRALFLSCILTSLSTFGQTSLDYYLPADVTYNQEIPTPQDILGYTPGDWHVSHDQLLVYARAIAEASDRMTIENYAKSYEGRQLLQIIVTSPENHANLNQIIASRKSIKKGEKADTKLVVQLGYSVHGNEASGANASLLTMYYLAAAQGSKIDKMLENTVIIVDPSYNPDGLNRFASWVNVHKSKVINPDPNDREYDEVWPGGRTNHYWFDLNRDWLPVQHPESQGRIRQFHKWMPNILTDHHEMGTSSTFFFQPGEPSRKFPNTDNQNPELTHEIAKFHAKALDSIGSLYYSKEGFDDFYIGKGSTYPDVNGSIGILFEQASSRGHAQESPYGVLTFQFAIRNHFVTSLSTLEASQALTDELKNYQLQQYRDASKWNSPNAYVFGDKFDKMKSLELVRILQNHDVKVNVLAKQTIASGQAFEANNAFIVSMNQPQARLIKSIFETRTSFTDSLFYDVSSWTLPLAMDIPAGELQGKTLDSSLIGDEVKSLDSSGQLIGGKSDYAYIFETTGYYSHRAIQRLLNAKVILRVLEQSHTSRDKTFPRGSILIPVGVQPTKSLRILEIINQIIQEDGLDVHAIQTGYAIGGIDLGSPSMTKIEEPRIALLVDEGVSSYEAGEAWHVLDQRIGVKVTKLPTSSVGSADLSRYNRIVMPNGSYGGISGSGTENLKEWVKNGGIIIAWKSAGNWLNSCELTKLEFKKNPADTTGFKSYDDYAKNRGATVTGGSIFQANIDVTHPLGYGFTRSTIPLFRNHNLILKKASNPYANPLVYTASPLMSGYVHQSNLENLEKAPAAQIVASGRGLIIYLSDNPNFRAFWYGTNKLFFNAIYFGDVISSGTAR